MRIYAHRGASAQFPEGTLAAYEGAVSQGADGFECDVRLTKDAQIICHHDSNTKALTGIDLEIAQTDYAQLKTKLDKAWQPMLFTDLLDLAIKSKKDLAIETKHPVPTGAAIENLLHKLLKAKDEEIKASGINISIMSFSWLATQRNIRSGFESVFLIAENLLINFNTAGVVGPSLGIIKNNPEFVVQQKKKGRRVFVWTVNDPADVILCEKLGVDVIMSDNPAQARKALGYS
jgi:glycerophosphoryl diester phosphodiesterase